ETEWEKAALWDAKTARRADPPWLATRADGTAVSLWSAVWAPYFRRGQPKPVGREFDRTEAGAPIYDEAPSGARDMWGNVRELVVVREGGREAPGVRGGSFASRVEERSTAFASFRPDPEFRAPSVGFRLAKGAE